MIEEIIIKFGTELKPTQYSWKSQLYMGGGLGFNFIVGSGLAVDAVVVLGLWLWWQ